MIRHCWHAKEQTWNEVEGFVHMYCCWCPETHVARVQLVAVPGHGPNAPKQWTVPWTPDTLCEARP